MVPYQFRPSPVGEIAERDRFLDELRECGSVTEAAARTGVAKSTLYRARRRFRSFAAAWDQVAGRGTDKLEAAMLDRAMNGVPRTRKLANGTVETWHEFPEAMAMFLLKARLPHIYGANAKLVAEPVPARIMTRDELFARIAAVRRSDDATPDD